MMFLWLSAALMVSTAVVHSLLGEKRLIRPILCLDSKVTNSLLARKILRCAWHLTSVFMISNALLVLWKGTPPGLVVVTGTAWLAVGLFDAVYTRGQHLGWPLLSGAGLFALLGVLV